MGSIPLVIYENSKKCKYGVIGKFKDWPGFTIKYGNMVSDAGSSWYMHCFNLD